MKKFNIFPYLLIFLASFLIFQLFQGKTAPNPVLDSAEIGIEVKKDEYAIGKEIRVVVQNNTEEEITIDDQCPLPPFNIYKYASDGFELVSSDVKRNCDNVISYSINPEGKTTISLGDFSYSYFGEVGRYKLELSINGESYNSPEFEIVEPGFITKIWRNIIFRPILNALVALIFYLPGHWLGLSIIVLTLVVRTILLGPSIKAIRAQRNMQAIQPKLEKLKEKYKDDQARLAQETMLLWKEHKVHPLSSCLPMLIQLPVLIALFYTIESGLTPDKSILLYSFLSDYQLADINPMFLGFNLLERSLFIFPISIGLLQFAQMQLMMVQNKKKNPEKTVPSEMETANNMMKYMMPLMIAFFTAQLPAAVGLYWGTSTFYGVIQQLVVNREGSSSNTGSKNEDDVSVRVINKSHGKAN